VTIFNTETLKTIRKVKANDPDFILYDPFSKRVFPMNEKITVLDATTGEAAAELNLGGDPESAVSDGKGTLYVNLADKGSVAVVDVQALKVTKTYPVDDCVSPYSMAFDAASQRLFIGSRNSTLAVVDALTGKVVAHQQTCSGVDAGAFDPDSKLVFISCSEGVISVIHEVSPDYYELIDTVKTQLWARTMAIDPVTKKIDLQAPVYLGFDGGSGGKGDCQPDSVKVRPVIELEHFPDSALIIDVAKCHVSDCIHLGNRCDGPNLRIRLPPVLRWPIPGS